MWQIRIGDKTLPEQFPTTNAAVQEFMRNELNKMEGGDSIKDPGAYVVGEDFAAYKICYPETCDKLSGHIATCGGSIVIRWDKALQEKLVAEFKENAEMFAWMNTRERWASVSSNFERGGVYRDHTVVFYDAKIGWIHAMPGNGYKEAVRNAMNMRINYETGEYFNPPK